MASEAITAVGEGGNLAASMACSRAVGIAMNLAINLFDRSGKQKSGIRLRDARTAAGAERRRQRGRDARQRRHTLEDPDHSAQWRG